MRIEIPRPPAMQKVPASTWAPWLRPGCKRWRLTRDFEVIVDGVRYVVPCGYVTDKASIPAWLWWLWEPGYPPALAAAIWHDRAYSHWYRTLSKRYADKVFREIMLAQGASERVAGLFHWAVKTFGKGGWGWKRNRNPPGP